MATVSGHNDRLPGLAHRHRSKATNTAVRGRRQQETTKEVEYIQQRDIRPDLLGTDSPVITPEDNTQPIPSSRRPKPQMRQRACRLRPNAQSQSTEKSPEKLLVIADGEKDAQTLPGINQADPGKISNPMPGKNQPQPSIDAAAAALLFPDGRSSTVCKTMTTYLTMTRTRADADTASTTSSSGMNTGFSWPTPTTSRVSSIVSSTPSVAPIQSFSTFVLFSRSEDIKEQVTSTSSFQSINTPLALTTSSTLTALFAPTARPTPSNIASSAVGGSSTGLSPLSRSLFVLFGVLGAITMLIAVAVFYAARRNRKQQEQAERYIEDVPFESTKAAAAVYDYGSKPRMSADTLHGLPPFLTESERNIVRRAATQDGQPEVHITAPGARLHDAINSFIAKSRRLTYKISP